MADNTSLPASSVKAATREVTYSGEVAQAQAVGLVAFSGSDDAKTVVDIPGDATYGLDVDITRNAPVVSGSGNLWAQNQEVLLVLNGEANTAFQITGTWTATVTFEASNDGGSNWSSIYAYRAGDNLITQTVVNSTNNDIYRCTTSGFGRVRARVSAYTSGTATIAAVASPNTSGVFINFPLPPGTSTIGAVNIAVPNPGTGGASTVNSTSSDGGTALTNAAQAIKASAGTLMGYYIYNPNATAAFVNFYNTAQGSVTVGTTNPLFHLVVPPTSAANLWMIGGIAFGTAMSWSATATAGSNTAPTTALDAVCWYV